MSGTSQGCYLSGLPLPASENSVEAPERPKLFCCEGCKGIWLMLHPEFDKGKSHEPADDGNL